MSERKYITAHKFVKIVAIIVITMITAFVFLQNRLLDLRADWRTFKIWLDYRRRTFEKQVREQAKETEEVV